MDEKGVEEQRFQAQAQVKAADRQTLTLAWNWEHPRLWDFGQPNLYTLKLAASGAGLDDEYPQVFGFREFWIEGRSFLLNGTEIRLRPSVIDWAEHCIAGNPQLMDAWMDGLAYAGFNCHEVWPKDHDERGSPHYAEAWAERADRKGWLLIGPALSAIPYVGQWNKAGAKELWEERMADALRDLRNHPSVLLWSTSPNYFCHGEDQDPRYIGRHKEIDHADWKQRATVGRALVAAIKRHDPSRPVLLHAGGPNGDVYSANTYLNLLPLQEREEWLTEWAQSGDMPYLAVEFGTPFDWTFLRGRWGQSATTTEPFFTEYSAIYLGPEAYDLETSSYREAIRRMHQQGDNYQSWQNTTVASYAAGFQKLEALFITNTWRSWRTFGISGGMIPWSDGFGWDVWGNEVRRKGKNLPDAPLAAFTPGQRGTWTDRASVNLIHPFRPEGMEIYPAGQALMQSNGPTLAWICGPAACFTAKDHNFAAGQNVEKQVALVNDERSAQDFSFSWEAFLQEKKIAQGGKEGRIETAKALFFPVQFQAPSLDGLLRAGGRIELKASIGKHVHKDTFHFGVFSKPAPARRSIAIFDPAGKTKALLASLGYGLEEWKGEKTASLLVVGREALSKGQPLPDGLEALVAAGGRAVIFEQNPDWLREALDFRVAPYVSRRVFPVAPEHPVVRGLETEDLWDWRGVSDLVPAYPLYGVRDPMWRSPDHGWHWGNRGAVSSAAIEKPHRSSWRPVLECEFDLAYSPLLELDYGKGRLTLCTLDLESHAADDPVAALLAGRIVEHAATADLAPKAAQVLALGTSTLLDELGVMHRKDKVLDPTAELVVVGVEAGVDETALRAYLEKGGKVLFLEQEATQSALGVKLARVDACAGSLHVPDWPECRGLSASDLRWRTEHAAWLIQDGAERGADGLLGRLAVGQGVALFCQIGPQQFDTAKQPYFRLTPWRQTRALAQLLANMGATFQMDRRAFQTATNVSTPRAAKNLPKEEGGWYHPDYRKDFEMGDDPYRYFRW